MNSGMYLWTNENVLKLINAYKSYPILWDMNLKDYRNRNQKTKAWQEIAAKFNVEKNEVIRKMNIILTQFRRERNKFLLSRSNNTDGQVINDIEVSKWFAFKSLSFLIEDSKSKFFHNHSILFQSKEENSLNDYATNVNTPYENETNQLSASSNQNDIKDDIKTIEQTSSSSVDSGNKSMTVVDDEYLNLQQSIKLKRKFTTPSTTIKTPTPPPIGNHQMLHPYSTYNSDDNIQKCNTCERDEYTIFGESIACKLRKLKNDKLKCLVQYKINTIMFEAEFDSYNSGITNSTQETTSSMILHRSSNDLKQRFSNSVTRKVRNNSLSNLESEGENFDDDPENLIIKHEINYDDS